MSSDNNISSEEFCNICEDLRQGNQPYNENNAFQKFKDMVNQNEIFIIDSNDEKVGYDEFCKIFFLRYCEKNPKFKDSLREYFIQGSVNPISHKLYAWGKDLNYIKCLLIVMFYSIMSTYNIFLLYTSVNYPENLEMPKQYIEELRYMLLEENAKLNANVELFATRPEFPLRDYIFRYCPEIDVIKFHNFLCKMFPKLGVLAMKFEENRRWHKIPSFSFTEFRQFDHTDRVRHYLPYIDKTPIQEGQMHWIAIANMNNHLVFSNDKIGTGNFADSNFPSAPPDDYDDYHKDANITNWRKVFPQNLHIKDNNFTCGAVIVLTNPGLPGAHYVVYFIGKDTIVYKYDDLELNADSILKEVSYYDLDNAFIETETQVPVMVFYLKSNIYKEDVK